MDTRCIRETSKCSRLETMRGTSPFIDIAAVEAWDAWFRWREPGRLRDISVESTWHRIARTLANVEPMQPAEDQGSALMSAFESWQLLLDERIFATAGTGKVGWPNDNLVAAVNAAMFVRSPFSVRACFDMKGFSATAELAVAALDNAAALGCGPSVICHRFRIGVIGLADALEFLQLRYDSAAARAQGGEIGRALAEGCFRGAVRSTKKPGVCKESSSAMLERAVERGMPTDLLNDARRHGLRHTQLTAISAQPHLSLFANNVADALDPIQGSDTLRHIVTNEQTRSVRSSGYAANIRQTMSSPTLSSLRAEKIEAPSISAQIAMRRAIQPWIDESINYVQRDTHAADTSAWQVAHRADDSLSGSSEVCS